MSHHFRTPLSLAASVLLVGVVSPPAATGRIGTKPARSRIGFGRRHQCRRHRHAPQPNQSSRSQRRQHRRPARPRQRGRQLGRRARVEKGHQCGGEEVRQDDDGRSPSAPKAEARTSRRSLGSRPSRLPTIRSPPWPSRRWRRSGLRKGTDFDRTYIQQEITAHQAVLDLANQAHEAAGNAELKDLIEQARPLIENHLKQAQAIEKELGRHGADERRGPCHHGPLHCVTLAPFHLQLQSEAFERPEVPLGAARSNRIQRPSGDQSG